MYAALLVCVVPSALAAGPPVVENGSTKGKKVFPVLWWSGLGRVTTGGGPVGTGWPKVELITEPKGFAKLWKRISMKGPRPSVDFDDHFVVVVTKPLGLALWRPFGYLWLDTKGNARIVGLSAEPDGRGSIPISGTLAIFPRQGVETVEGKKLPPTAK